MINVFTEVSMDNALFLSELDNLASHSDTDFQRLYIGTEFCSRLLYGGKQLDALFECLDDMQVDFTLLTPWVTEKHVKKLYKIMEGLPEGSEIVFNDWGLIEPIKALGHIPVCGRLLVSIKSDVRIISDMKTFSDLKTSNLNSIAFQEFLHRQGIRRIELNNVHQGYNFKPHWPFSLSLYLPFVYITTSRKCIASYDKTCILNDNCNYECKRFFASLDMAHAQKSLVMQGNSIFYVNKEPFNNYRQLGVDRLVHFPGQAPFGLKKTGSASCCD